MTDERLTTVPVSGVTRLLLVAYFIEAGALLIVAPWSAFWERNYFLSSWPMLETLLRSDWVRGAVSGLGVINLCAGLIELAGFFIRRQH